MKVVSKVIDLSLPPLASEEVDESEVPRHRPLTQPSEGQEGPSESKGPPINRLKLVFKRGQVPQEVPPTDSLARRPVRAVEQPTVPPTAEAPSTANKQARGSRKKDTGIVCAKCNRGHSPRTNMIVFCDGCNQTWHQKCHDPPIDNEVVRIKDAQWFCKECKPEPTPASPASRPAPTSKTSREIRPRLEQATSVNVGGNQFTPDETRAYLSSLSHAALVELVVNVSTRNPDVAMFPANLRDLPATAFPVPSAPTYATTTTATVPNKKNGSRTASVANDDPSEDRPVHPRKRTRTTSAPAPPMKKTRATSAATEQPAEAGPARKRARPTSAPAPSRKRTRAASAATEQPADAGPARKRARTTSASTKPPAAAASPKTRKPSTSSRRQASAQPSAPKKPTRRSKDRPAKSRPPPRSTRNTSTDESEPQTAATSDDDFFDEEDHRTYPESGKGFFPSTSDLATLDLLREDPDCPSISHKLYGQAKVDRDLGKPPRVWPETSS